VKSNNLKALILGATGLVGGELLIQLLKDDSFTSVTSLTRSPTGMNHPKLQEEIVDFELLENSSEFFKVDVVFCCLGTTIKKVKGDKNLFRKVDLDYPIASAKLALSHKVKQFVLISSLGADSDSSVFYSKTKGECEKELKNIGIERVHVIRPSLLSGHRKESRPLEQISILSMKFINPLLMADLKKYRSVDPKKVATVMIDLVKGRPKSHEIETLTF
tara:strand:+ start:27428 stop:28081 length:654 start_codon:yes stop_codon:yes gene_type:complete